MDERFNAEKLRRLRRDHCLTQSGLARKLHVEAQSVCRWERGEAEPRAAHVRALCRVLRIARSELFVPAEVNT